MHFKFLVSVLILLWIIVPQYTQAQYQINGNAIQTECNCYRLTTANNNQNGSVWNVNLFDLSESFNFTFDVFLGCNDDGADGLAFVLQPLSVNAGSVGGGIGYAGISPSLAIELDTYQNSGEPSYDHMAIQQNGDVSHNGPNNLAGPTPISASSNNVEDCAWHLLNIVWDATANTMTVYFDGALRLTYTGDIVNAIFGGNPEVYWGFTAATGGANNEHRFCNALDPAFIITSPQQCMGIPVDFESVSAVATGQITAFEWDFGDGTTATGGQVSHSYATPGTYDVQLTISSEGCTETSTTQVTIHPLPTFNVGADQAICDGETFQISPTGLAGDEQVQWDPVMGLDNAYVANPIASPSSTTTYTLAVLDANGCPNVDDITITVNPLPIANAGADQAICEQSATSMAASGGVAYSWTPTTGLTNPTSATTQASPAATTTYSVTVTDVNGCQQTDDMTLTVHPQPTLLAGSDASMCEGESVQLAATGSTTSYTWNPSTNLNNANIPNPIFNGVSTTTLTVTGTDANGCTATDDVEITVFPLPIADFSPPADACLGTPMQLANNSTGNNLLYEWSFGDGSPINTNENPMYTYTADGTYTVQLNVTDANGCAATSSDAITVYPLPTATMNITDGQEFCEQETIQFSNLSTISATSIHWDFGDNAFLPAYPNTTSNLNNPTFSYSNFAFSPYTVTLGITDALGCYGQTQTTIIVHDKPSANFSVTTACHGEATQFADQSHVHVATITNWNWEFGDGTGIATSANPMYEFDAPGIYQTQLIAESSAGCLDTIVNQVLVNPTPTIYITGTDTCLNQETTFSNNSVPQNNTIISWDWDFGDGTTATGPLAATTYTNHGIFDVSLTATTDSGCTATGSTQVQIFPNPEPAFTINNPEGCTPHDVFFFNQSTIATGQNALFNWDFGNGQTAAVPNPQQVFPDSGYYTVSLLVTSTDGCTASFIQENAVRANITPVANFIQSNDKVSLLDAVVELTDASEHALAWDWSLGDGTSTSIANPTHTYQEPGVYDILLTVTNGDCYDTHEGRVKVEPIFTFYVPSAFTPDNNNVNETFFGSGEGIKEYNMQIYTRWGDLIFESNDLGFHWDGSLKGKPAEAGMYTYKFLIRDVFNYAHEYVGAVHLLR